MFCHPGQQSFLLSQFLLSLIENCLAKKSFANLDSKKFCYPGQLNVLLSRIAKSFAIQGSQEKNFFQSWINVPKLKSFLSWIANFCYLGQQNVLLSSIAKHIEICISREAKQSRIAKLPKIAKLCYPGQQNFLQSWIAKHLAIQDSKTFCYPGQQTIQLSRIAKENSYPGQLNI